MKIAVIGNGRVGSCAAKMLRDSARHVATFDVGYPDSIFEEYDAFLAATPFEVTADIAEQVSQRKGKLYFDLTEDVEVGRQLRKGSKSIMVPHCGVAPGAVSIIAGALTENGANSLTMRVGALPIKPSGKLKYSLNWSTAGLVNEYIKPCVALRDYKKAYIEPMGDLQNVYPCLEAFNTSGGIGTIVDTGQNFIENATYQTLRYRGHHAHMQFLLEDLGFRHKPAALIELLDDNLPRNEIDKVIIDVAVADVLKTRERHRIIYGTPYESAIQIATAAGVVAVMQWVIDHPEQAEDLVRDDCWIANEDIPITGVEEYTCWRSAYGVLEA